MSQAVATFPHYTREPAPEPLPDEVYPALPPRRGTAFGKTWPPRTRDGRKLPHRLNWATFVQAVPGVFSESDLFATVVPEEFVAFEYEEDGGSIATIACPCGEEPEVPIARTKLCNCNRMFLNLGDEVRVWNPDQARGTAALVD